MDPKQRLRVLVESSTPIVVIETLEEVRALRLIQEAAAELQLPVFEWSIADGLSRCLDAQPVAAKAVAQRASTSPNILASGQSNGSAMYNTKEAAQVLSQLRSISTDALYVLKDIHRQLDDPVVIRLLREAAQQFSQARRTIIITAPTLSPVPELQNEIEYLDLPLPDAKQLAQLVAAQFSRLAQRHKLQDAVGQAGYAAIAENLRGLTEDEANRAIAEAIIARGGLFPATASDVLEAKREILRRSGMLEFVPVQDALGSVGGLENLKKWLRVRQVAIHEAATSGLEMPRGVLIFGMQGCGKSLCARTIAGEWKLPLVKFDPSAVFDKYMGETEKRIKKVFSVAEQLAPCVLWIDEIEKAFAGGASESAASDAGAASRLLGAFLSWMQERKAPVFVVATSNDVAALPPELIRKGRFDELFFVDLPNEAERQAILQLHLQKRHMAVASFDLPRLVAATKGFSGAEIEAAVQSAMYQSFAEKLPLTTETLLAQISATAPLSATRAEDLTRLRQWAAARCVPAS